MVGSALVFVAYVLLSHLSPDVTAPAVSTGRIFPSENTSRYALPITVAMTIFASFVIRNFVVPERGFYLRSGLSATLVFLGFASTWFALFGYSPATVFALAGASRTADAYYGNALSKTESNAVIVSPWIDRHVQKLNRTSVSWYTTAETVTYTPPGLAETMALFLTSAHRPVYFFDQGELRSSSFTKTLCANLLVLEPMTALKGGRLYRVIGNSPCK